MVWSRKNAWWALLAVLGGVVVGCESSRSERDGDDGGDTAGQAGGGDVSGGVGGQTGGRASGGTTSGGTTSGGSGGNSNGGTATGGAAGAARGGDAGDSSGAGSSAGGASGVSGKGGSAGSGGAAGSSMGGGANGGNAGAGMGPGGAGGATGGSGGSLGSGAAPNGASCERGGLCASGHCLRGMCAPPPNWGAVQALGTLTGPPSVAMPEFGKAAVAWNYDLGDQVYANVATNKTFGTAQRIDTQTGSVNNMDPTVAYAGSQKYLVTWSETVANSDYNAWMRVYDGSWGMPIDVDGTTLDMGNVTLATNLSGNGALLWLDRSQGTLLGKLVTGTTLGAQVDGFGYSFGRSVGVSPSGRVAVAWCLAVTATNDLWVRTYTPGVGWSAAQEAWRGTLQRSCEDTRVAINDAGEIMVTWESRIGVRVPMGAFRTAAGVWEYDLLADTAGTNSASFPRPVFSASGALMVSWTWFDSTRPSDRCYLHYRVRSGGRWTPVVEVDACSYDDAGNALATYDYESFRMIYAKDPEAAPGVELWEARYVGGKGVVEKRRIAPGVPVVFGFNLALDADGRGLLAWVYKDDTFPAAPGEVRAMWLE